MPVLTPAQIAASVIPAGFSGKDIQIAIAVALAESGGKTDATNRNSNGSTDHGLFQINSVHRDLLSRGDWRNPTDNARMAKTIWDQAGGKWRPWAAYTNGSYLKFMTQAGTALRDPSLLDKTKLFNDSVPTMAGAAIGASPIDDFAGKLRDKNLWYRVGMVVGGCGLLWLGVNRLTGTDKLIIDTVKGALA